MITEKAFNISSVEFKKYNLFISLYFNNVAWSTQPSFIKIEYFSFAPPLPTHFIFGLLRSSTFKLLVVS